MITWAAPLACGNAVSIILLPPSGAVSWRILRLPADDIDGFDDQDDPDAVAYEGLVSELDLTDYAGLVNGTAYSYRVYYWDGDDWTEGNTVEITPAASYTADGPDPQDILIERIDAGLKIEVARGNLTPPSGMAAIDVLRAFAIFDQGRMPVVTVEFVSNETQDRALGEVWGSDDDETTAWREWAGWKRHWTLAVVAWALNADERIALRQALERIILANLQVFDAAGLYNIDLAWQDIYDDLQYDAPVYTAIGTVTCAALSRVGMAVGKIADVVVAPQCDVS
jgi:hypothetical protein